MALAQQFRRSKTLATTAAPQPGRGRPPRPGRKPRGPSEQVGDQRAGCPRRQRTALARGSRSASGRYEFSFQCFLSDPLEDTRSTGHRPRPGLPGAAEAHLASPARRSHAAGARAEGRRAADPHTSQKEGCGGAAAACQDCRRPRLEHVRQPSHAEKSQSVSELSSAQKCPRRRLRRIRRPTRVPRPRRWLARAFQAGPREARPYFVDRRVGSEAVGGGGGPRRSRSST